MSFDALAWAAKQHPGDARMKLVLLGLAECASRPDALAFPSTAALVEFSSLDRKTVVATLDRLEAAGYISDTGRRAGRTMQIKVYQLNLESLPKTEPSQKRDASKGSQISRERLPKTGHGISKGISTSTAKAVSVARKTTFGQEFPTDDRVQTFRVWAVQWAVGELHWRPGDAGGEFARFADSNIANGRTYKDWKAAWRNWCRSAFCVAAKQYEDRTAYRREPLRG